MRRLVVGWRRRRGRARAAAAGTATSPAEKQRVFRFLNQATFGATDADAEHLLALERPDAYARWIDEQLAAEPSLQLAYVQAALPDPLPAGFDIARSTRSGRTSGSRTRCRARISCASASPGRCRRSWWSRSRRSLRAIRSGLARLLRHARARRLRRFPRAARGRDAAPDDGRVPLDAGQPESRTPRATSAPTRTTRASSCSCSRSAWCELNPTARRSTTRRTSRFRPTIRPSSRGSRTCSRAGTGRAPGSPRAAGSATRARRCRTRFVPMQAFPEQHATGAKQLLAYPGAAKRIAAGRPDARAGSRRRARQHLQPPERRAVHRARS